MKGVAAQYLASTAVVRPCEGSHHQYNEVCACSLACKTKQSPSWFIDCMVFVFCGVGSAFVLKQHWGPPKGWWVLWFGGLVRFCLS